MPFPSSFRLSLHPFVFPFILLSFPSSFRLSLHPFVFPFILSPFPSPLPPSLLSFPFSSTSGQNDVGATQCLPLHSFAFPFILSPFHLSFPSLPPSFPSSLCLLPFPLINLIVVAYCQPNLSKQTYKLSRCSINLILIYNNDLFNY